MVRRSHRDGPGSANQAPRDRASGTNGATDVPAEGQHGGAQGPAPGPVTAWPVMAGGGVWVCSVTLTWFLLVWKETQEPGLRLVDSPACDDLKRGLECYHPYLVPRMGRRGALGQPPAACERGRGKWTRDARFTTLLLLRPRDWGNCSFIDVWVPLAAGPAAEQKQNETKDSPPGPPPGEGVAQSPSPTEQSPPSPGRPSQGLLHLRLPPGLAGAWTGWASCLRPAPRRCLVEGCCGCAGAGAAAEGRPRRRAGWGTAAGVEAAGFPPAHDVFNRLSLLLCCRELLGKALDRVAEEAGLRHGRHSGTAPSPAPSCQRDTARDGAPDH